MQESRDNPLKNIENVVISKNELNRLSALSEEQLNQEAQHIQASNKQSSLSDEALIEIQKTEREATAAEKILTDIFKGFMKEAEEEAQRRELLAEDMRTEEEKKRKEEEEEKKKKKKADDEDMGMEDEASTIDPESVVDFVRNKSPEDLAKLVNKYSSMIPTSSIVNGINDISMSQLAAMAPFMADFKPITEAIDGMGSKEKDNPQTMASLKKLSDDLKGLQTLMEQMSAWNDNPTTDDQKLQNLDLLTQMKDRLAAITEQPILKSDPNLQKIAQAFSKKIQNELDKVDETIKNRYKEGEKPQGNNKTPDQIAKKLGDLAKQIKLPTGSISVGLRFASMEQVAKAATSFAKSLSNVSRFLDKAKEKCDGNAETRKEFDKLSKSLHDTEDLLRKLGDEKEGWKSNPKGDDVRHNHALLQQMKKQLDDIENNPLMKNSAALKDVQKVTKALRDKIQKESAKLEKQDPSLKSQPTVISSTNEHYDCDKGMQNDRYTRDQLSAAAFCEEHGLKAETSHDRESVRYSTENGAEIEFNRETREISLLNEDEASAALAADFAQHVLRDEELEVTATAENMPTMQYAFKEADLTATFKEAQIPTPPSTPTVTQAQTQELTKETEEEEKSSLSSSMSMKPPG